MTSQDRVAAHPGAASFEAALAAPSKLCLREVEDERDWRSARRLRFEGLAGRGEIPAAGEHAFADDFDGVPATRTFLLVRGERAIGTTRYSVSAAGREAPLPAHAVFAREIERAFGARATVVESSLTFVDPVATREPRDALLLLFGAQFRACESHDADALIVAARGAQLGFFRRMFDMEILSGAEHYPGMATARVLMGVPFRERAPLLMKRIPALARHD